jgi:hypothetical protein
MRQHWLVVAAAIQVQCLGQRAPAERAEMARRGEAAMHIGKPEPIEKFCQGSFGTAERQYEIDRAYASRRLDGDRTTPDLARTSSLARRNAQRCQDDYPAVEAGWTGVPMVGDAFEVA